ncbi:AAA family ATPase [Desulfosarcina sp. OttesenSCG-928-B08]|nr:AAA family ATPase [Desulfosarcina sp. OttesenSCG-928-B08]
MIRITHINIQNFKSLLDVKIIFPEESPVMFLTGLNGAGKSTLLQAIDFIGALMRGNMEDWFSRRKWEDRDLFTRIHRAKQKILIQTTIRGIIGNQAFEWKGQYNPKPSMMRCTAEIIEINKERILSVKDGRLTMAGSEERTVDFTYTGSVLSQLNDKSLDAAFDGLSRIKHHLAAIHSFDMLSPRDMKKRTRKSSSIGMSGESISGYMANLDEAQRNLIQKMVSHLHPWISKFDIRSFRSGWKELRIYEDIGTYPDPHTGSDAKWIIPRSLHHINDGTLRLLAIAAALVSEDSILLFDEIENGFNPHIINKLVNLLFLAEHRQIVVTTHSPEILQYIPDSYVADCVRFLYRKDDASTGIANLFDSAEANRKLTVLGPGEVFLDLDLEALAREFQASEEKEKKADRGPA